MEASPLLGQFTWVSQAEIPFFWGVELFPASIWGLPEGYWLDSKLLATVLPSLWFITETIIMAKISILFAQFFCGHSTFVINVVCPCKAGRPDSLFVILSVKKTAAQSSQELPCICQPLKFGVGRTGNQAWLLRL